MTNEDLQQIQNLVTGARKVLVLTHANPSVDTMASALAMFLAFSKMGKDTTVAMETPPLVEVANLVGIDKVQTTLGTAGGGNLVLTYKPYQIGDFEKVTYNENPSATSTTEDSFSLTITPRPGYSPDPKNFQVNVTAGALGTFDLIVTVELLEPSQAGKLYDQQLFASGQIINIDNHDPNKDYGKFNLVEPDAASISEIVTFFLRAINAQIDADMANNLYQGIVSASSNFQSTKVAAATFEAAAICLRAGAKAAPKAVPTGSVPFDSQPVAPVRPQPVTSQPVQMSEPQAVKSVPVSPAPTNTTNSAPQEVPTDWTQPKVYRGTSVS